MGTTKTTVRGFGFDSSVSEHHFQVSIANSLEGVVQISEHTSWQKDALDKNTRAVKSDDDSRLRVVLTREKWDVIADVARNEFNRRLRQTGQKRGAWKARGLTPVSRLFGKELVLLAWAIEDADPTLIPVAITNWLGLTPEERWWMFTMTNAATGHAIYGKSRGWRKAVQYSLTENPVSAVAPAQQMGLVANVGDADVNPVKHKKSRQQGTLTQFTMR
jgi:hypothetical protein